MGHLLDTNTIVDHFRKGSGSRVTPKLLSAQADTILLSSVVVGELIYGAHRSGPSNLATNLALITGLQSQYKSLPFDDVAAEHYGRIRQHLESIGQTIGPNDLLIAATALANGLTLVTHNTAEFSRVPGLPLEDWI